MPDTQLEYMATAMRLEQPLGVLGEAMTGIERMAYTSQSSYMPQVVAEQAKWQQLQELTQPLETLAAALADRAATQHILELLAPTLVFPAATPMQRDDSGAVLHALRQTAELYKENLRRLIAAHIGQLDAKGRIA